METSMISPGIVAAAPLLVAQVAAIEVAAGRCACGRPAPGASWGKQPMKELSNKNGGFTIKNMDLSSKNRDLTEGKLTKMWEISYF